MRLRLLAAFVGVALVILAAQDVPLARFVRNVELVRSCAPAAEVYHTDFLQLHLVAGHRQDLGISDRAARALSAAMGDPDEFPVRPVRAIHRLQTIFRLHPMFEPVRSR